MNKDKIIKDYKIKIRELIKNNKYYYEDNKIGRAHV